MSQSCTIYSEKKYSHILTYLEGSELRDVSKSNTKSFEKNYSEGKLRVSIEKRIYSGDSFSQMILGTWNFVRDIETKYDERKKELITLISNCQSAIGIVATPEFTETDTRLDFVFEVTALFDGVIFNGFEMLDKNGRVILDKAGNSELN